jgi:hypothetical protein
MAELRLIDWAHGKSKGSFWDGLIKIISQADEQNMCRLGEGFPEEVKTFKRYREEQGYWEDVMRRYETNFSEDNNDKAA